MHLVTEVHYDTPRRSFASDSVSFGSERMHTVANQVAAGLTGLDIAPSREEITQRVATVAAGRWRRPVLVLGIDGAYVPTRPDSAREPQDGPRCTRARRARWRGQWRDAKGFRLYLLDEERIVHLLSWHQVQTEEQLGEALRQIKNAGVIPEGHVRLCVVADGPSGYETVQRYFLRPDRCSIYHCAQYITRSPNPIWWVLQTGRKGRSEMSGVLGRVRAVLGGLRRCSQPPTTRLINGNGVNSATTPMAYHLSQLRRGGTVWQWGRIVQHFHCHVRSALWIVW